MPGKWQIVNGVRYPIDDHASPRSTPEEYNPYDDPVFQRRIASLQADMRGSKKGGTLDDNLYPDHPLNKTQERRTRRTVPKCMRTRTGTDYRKLVAQREAAVTIQRHFRGMIVRNPMDIPIGKWLSLVAGPIEKEEPIYEQRSMIDRWMDGAEFLEEPEVEPIEESEEPGEEPEEMQCHPVGWTKKNHYSELGWQWCGQSCPCCRARVGDTIGACPVCIRERE